MGGMIMKTIEERSKEQPVQTQKMEKTEIQSNTQSKSRKR